MRTSTLKAILFALAMIFIAPTASLAIVSAEEIKKEEAKNLEGLSEPEKDKAANKMAEEESDARQQFSGFNPGVFLVTNLDLGNREIVDSAVLAGDPKVVRLQKDSGTQVGFGLETHYFFLPNFRLFGFSELGKGKWGVGPYVGLTFGSQNIIDTIGAGVMLGLRRDAFFALLTDGSVAGKPRGDSFNISIGAYVNPDAQVLGAGIKPNKPLPAGEDQIRYRTTTQGGIQIGFSYTFDLSAVTGN